MADELLPCPFCGCENINVRYYSPWHSICCNECQARTAGWADEATAIAAWNRRASVASESEVVAALTAELRDVQAEADNRQREIYKLLRRFGAGTEGGTNDAD